MRSHEVMCGSSGGVVPSMLHSVFKSIVEPTDGLLEGCNLYTGHRQVALVPVPAMMPTAARERLVDVEEA